MEKNLAPELQSRLEILTQAPETSDRLFFSGDRPELQIAHDFVYLDTNSDREKRSQADIYAVVENLLACCRANDNGLSSKPKKDGVTAWVSSVYAHLLICPSNFQIYNDAILRAALLRAATPAELLFSTDEECSGEVLNVILSEVEAWSAGGGASLPEFMIAMATGHLRLVTTHRNDFIRRLRNQNLPQHLKDLADEIESPQSP
jgi:hypothetical protein